MNRGQLCSEEQSLRRRSFLLCSLIPCGSLLATVKMRKLFNAGSCSFKCIIVLLISSLDCRNTLLLLTEKY